MKLGKKKIPKIQSQHLDQKFISEYSLCRQRNFLKLLLLALLFCLTFFNIKGPVYFNF